MGKYRRFGGSFSFSPQGPSSPKRVECLNPKDGIGQSKRFRNVGNYSLIDVALCFRKFESYGLFSLMLAYVYVVNTLNIEF